MMHEGGDAMQSRLVRISSIAIAAILLMLPSSRSGAAEGDFDHLRTGFPLTGAHERVDCRSCHVRGFFEGTPTRCGACHIYTDQSHSNVKEFRNGEHRVNGNDW